MVLILSSCATSPIKWNKNEKYLAGSFIVGQTINFSQINYIYDHPNFHERSPHIDKIHNKHGMTGIALWKTGSTLFIFKMADSFPKHRTPILIGANFLIWAICLDDRINGARLSFRF